MPFTHLSSSTTLCPYVQGCGKGTAKDDGTDGDADSCPSSSTESA
jgi:hypothetical protein